MSGPVAEQNIPSLGLPPAITLQNASPATTPGWGALGMGSLVASPRVESQLGTGGISVFGKRVVGEGITSGGVGGGGMSGIGGIGGMGGMGAGGNGGASAGAGGIVGPGKRGSVEGGSLGSLPKRQNSHESSGSGQGE